MKKLYLSDTDSKIFGLCGGIGETYDLDPTIVRLAAVFLCIATGILPLLVTYLVSGKIVPKKPTEQPEAKSDSE